MRFTMRPIPGTDNVRELIQKLKIRLRIRKQGQIVIIFACEYQMPLAFDKLIEKRRFSDLSRPQNDFSPPGRIRR